ncbi:MAG: hypothetical protein NZ765_08760, partial [Anaerolineae bacterium]|nr:hypothetical protein [Anaerolineae bacterium]
KPQISFLIVPGMLLWALWQRRIRVGVSFGITLVLLLLLPAIWLPDWPLHWLVRLQRYADDTFFVPPLQLLTGGIWWSWIIAGIMVLWPMAVWWHARQGTLHRSASTSTDLREVPELRDWLFSWLIAVTAMIAPRTTQANQLVLLLPLFYLFVRLSGRRAPLIIAVVETGIVILVWLVAVLVLPATHDPEYTLQEHQWISPILPVGITAMLWSLSIWPRRRAMVEAH